MLRVVKYQPTGAVIWDKRYLGVHSLRTAVAFDQDGNSYLADSTSRNNKIVAILLKLAADGTTRWERVLDDVERWNAIAVDPSGDLIVTGNSRIASEETVVTAKFRTTGDEIWRKSYSHPHYPGVGGAEGFQVRTDSAGTIYVLASIAIRPTTLTLLKYTSSGQPQWTKDIHFSGGVTGSALGLTKTNECIVATGADQRIDVWKVSASSTVTLIGTGSVLVDRPLISGIVNLKDNDFLVHGTQIFARVTGGKLIIVQSEGAGAARAGFRRELYIGDYKRANNFQTYGTLSALFEGYPSSLPFYSWQEKIYGTPDPSTAYRYGSVSALALDSNGDLVVGGIVTMNIGLRAFIAKYRCDPIAIPDVYDVQTGVALEVEQSGILSNDAQTRAAMLTLTSTPSNGSLTLASDGSFTYRPNAGFAGRDWAYYRLTRDGVTSVASIEFRVYPALLDAKFTPISIVGGSDLTLRAKVAAPFSEATTLPVSGATAPIVQNGDSIYFAPGAEWGSRTMRTATVSAIKTVTVTITSGTSTRSATVTVRP